MKAENVMPQLKSCEVSPVANPQISISDCTRTQAAVGLSSHSHLESGPVYPDAKGLIESTIRIIMTIVPGG